MKEIHFIINSLEVGGAERHLSQVLPALKSMGFSIKVIVLSNKAALKPIFDKAGIPVALGPNFDCLPNIIRKPIYLLTSVFRLMFNFFYYSIYYLYSFLIIAGSHKISSFYIW